MNKKNSLRLSIAFHILYFITSSVFGQHLPSNSVYHNIDTSDGHSLYALEIGNRNPKKTFIVLHGGFGAEHSYLIPAILPHIEENRFILFDQRGSLRSSVPDSLITFNNFINDIEQIRKEFDLDKINILAHSNGTTIALDYLFHFPGVVEKTILIASPLSIVDS